MKIRKATLKDLNEIDRIYAGGVVDEVRLQFSTPKQEAIKEAKKYERTRKQGFRRSIQKPKHYWIVAEIGGKIAGFGQAMFELRANHVIGWIENVYIAKSARGKGLGMKLARELVGWLRLKKVEYIESDIFWNNRPSIKLHKKLGFKPVSLRMRLLVRKKGLK